MRTFAVFVVTGWLALLAGCGGTTDAAPPSPSPTPTPSASASPTAPVMPDAARKDTKAGAVAFVRFYIAAFNHAQATGDVSTLRSLGAKGCVSCNAVVKTIVRTYQSGGHVDGGRWLIDGHDVQLSTHGQLAVYISGHFEPANTYSGTNKHHNKGGPIVATFVLRHDRPWKVNQWTRA